MVQEQNHSQIRKLIFVVFALLASQTMAQTQKGSDRPLDAQVPKDAPASKPVTEALDIGECPETAKELPPEKDFACTCSGQIFEAYDGYEVWGTYIYAVESRICNAAIHSGVIRKGVPGQILIHFVPPPAVLRGTTQNGIKTKILPYPPKSPPFQLAPG